MHQQPHEPAPSDALRDALRNTPADAPPDALADVPAEALRDGLRNTSGDGLGDAPPDVPAEALRGGLRNTPADAPRDALRKTSGDVLRDGPPDVSAEALSDAPRNKRPDALAGVPAGAFSEAPRDAPADVPPQSAPADVSPETAPEASSQAPRVAPPPGSPARPPVRVLVVDDDPTVAEVVAGYLDRAGYVVDLAADGPAALTRAAAHRPDLVVLDLMLPGMDGLEVCRRMRGQGPVPVIMLTARGDEDDRVLGLEVGADDYVTKPFSPRELVLRVESVLRRTRPAAVERPLGAAGLTVDPAARRATRNGARLALTLREFDLLAFFLRHPGRAFAREELMREVWGWDFGDLSTVTVHVRRLRGKVEDDPARPRLIQTVWGVGYRFDPAGQEAG